MTKIAVTGGSGKAGRAVVRDLLERGYEVLNIDRVPSAESHCPESPAPFLPAELTDFGQTLEALSGGGRGAGLEAGGHLAAGSAPGHPPPRPGFRAHALSPHPRLSPA